MEWGLDWVGVDWYMVRYIFPYVSLSHFFFTRDKSSQIVVWVDRASLQVFFVDTNDFLGLHFHLGRRRGER
jgi:hypothetical protein